MRFKGIQFGGVVLLCVFFLGWGAALAGEAPALLLTLHVKQGSMDRTGLAFANPTAQTASIQLFLLDSGGNLASGQAPLISIQSNQQRAVTLAELFPDAGDVEAFILGVGDNFGLVGFFLTFAPDVSQIDGAEAVISNVFPPSIVFPELLTGEGESTELNVIALGAGSVTLDFDLCDESGACQRQTRSVAVSDLSDLGRFSTDVREMFGDAALAGADPQARYVTVSTSTPNSGLLGYQEFQGANFRGGRNALRRGFGSSRPFALFGAQIAATSAITTDVRLINPSSIPANVTLSLFETGLSGGNAAASASLVIPAGGVVKRNIRDFVQLPPQDFVGWLRVDSDVNNLIGNVTFFDPAKTFLSSVQMESTPIREIVYSHLADGLGFFTGLTFLNVTPDPLSVDIEVFNPSGTMTGSSTFQLAGFEHGPRLLSEIIPGFQPQIGGFIKMTASAGVFSFEQFGFVTNAGLTSLSAVPPQRGAGTISGQVAPAAGQSPSQRGRARQIKEAFLRRQFAHSWRKGVQLDPDKDFRPGEVIVRFTEAAGPSASNRLAGEFGLRVASQAPGRVSLMKVESGPESLQQPASGGSLKDQTVQIIERLNQRNDVVYAQPNHIYRATGATTPNDTLFDRMWHLNAIFVPEAWEITTGSSDIVIAVLDTGAKFSHPDLGPRLTGGQADFIDDPQNALDGDGRDFNADDPGDDPSQLASSYHGTHVAGTIGAVTNNGQGIAGVNQVSPLMTLRVLGAEGGTEFDIWQAALFSVGLPNVLGQSPAGGFVPARILNMSLGGTGTGPFAAEASQDVLNTGAIVVAAAGNSNTDEPHYPADLPGVLKIGATDLVGQKAPYSNFGNNDFVAPGGDMSADVDDDGFADGVLSTLWDQAGNSPEFDFYQGTSMATPHVAGVISLMLSADPGLTREQVVAILQDTSTLPAEAAPSPQGELDPFFGHGIVNAFKAVSAAAGFSLTDPRLALSPTNLDFATFREELGVKLINLGGGTLNVNSPQLQTDSGGSWLGASVDGDDLTVTVNRASLPDGRYTGRVNLTSNGGAGTVEVAMQVGVDEDSDIGDMFVLVLDPRTRTSAGQAMALFKDGYTYNTTPILAGDYQVIAGTDEDGDRLICEPLDHCGGWPVTNQPGTVTVRSGEDTPGIDFTVAASAVLDGAGSSAGGNRSLSTQSVVKKLLEAIQHKTAVSTRKEPR